MRALPCVLFAAVVVAAVGCSDDPVSTDASTTTAPPETTTTTEAPLEAGLQLAVYTPAVGDCYDRRTVDPPPDQVGQVPSRVVLKLDCVLPHQYEIFEVLAFPFAGDDHPGDDALESHARQSCPDSFEAYVGLPYEVSELEITFYLPTAAEWEEGARTIGCAVFDLQAERMLGTARDVAR